MNIASGLLVLYILAVGWKGNAGEAVTEFGKDGSEFVPWMAAIIILLFMRQTRFKPIVEPFIVLALIATITKNWTVAKTDAVKSYEILSGKGTK